MSPDEREVLHQAHVLKALSETSGWKVYVEMLQNRVDIEATKAMSASLSMDEMVAKEYAKGTFNGLRLAMTLPEITVATAIDIRQRYNLGASSGSGAKDLDEGSGPNEAPSHPIGKAP